MTNKSGIIILYSLLVLRILFFVVFLFWKKIMVIMRENKCPLKIKEINGQCLTCHSINIHLQKGSLSFVGHSTPKVQKKIVRDKRQFSFSSFLFGLNLREGWWVVKPRGIFARHLFIVLFFTKKTLLLSQSCNVYMIKFKTTKTLQSVYTANSWVYFLNKVI